MTLKSKWATAICVVLLLAGACRPPDAPAGSIQSIGTNLYKAEIIQRAKLSCRESMIRNLGLFSGLISRTTQAHGINQLKHLQKEIENSSILKISLPQPPVKSENTDKHEPFQWCALQTNQSEDSRKAQEYNLDALDKRMISSSLHYATAVELQSIARDRIAYALTGKASGMHVSAIDYHISDDTFWIDDTRNILLATYLKIWTQFKADPKNKDWESLKNYSDKLLNAATDRKIDFKLSSNENKIRQEQSQKAIENLKSNQLPHATKEHIDKLLSLLR